ncbi:hypothetical protein SAMN02982929_07234 [Saccharopolyspora kobensis]|uniref:Terminase small subunit n=1 Tax=Saccharopolyspora kobensis TaxID=146035 RepID=A0A1H6ELW8_9PSEU|nr:hypothetical protein [Saccharopolyspora kobensis]SEG98852.1 hypothetical protein SAMN02982929_07234 [Saccharopolyspora kobensis]SFD22829.1 hypothetical protein SAMN05216506_103144 [Saccharopolyspora kobensis]
MPRGGARVSSGPAPDPNALRRDRRDDAAGWQILPANGRQGDVPRWPLDYVGTRERDLWRDLWAQPQAVMWERLAQHYEVAMCVRAIVRTEADEAKANDFTVARQFMDSLGLSVNGMLRNRWKVDGAEPEPVTEAAKTAPARRSARDRLKVVADE